MSSERRHLLVVEGDGPGHGHLSKTVESLGHTVTVAQGGGQARNALRTRKVDVVLWHAELSDREGPEVLRALKGDGTIGDVAVIVVASVQSPERIGRWIESGADDYLTLPATPAALSARLRVWLENRSLRERALACAEEAKGAQRLADDLIRRILPIGVALSAEKDFDRLLERILKEAKSICDADGGTLYLREGKHLRFAIMLNDSLGIAIGGAGDARASSRVALYDERTGEGNTHNVASAAALLGRSINVPDIWNSAEFDFSGTKSFDEKNGYRSISSLTVPLTSHDNEVIGVLQLLNAQDPRNRSVIPFDAYMQQVVEALASQAAVVLNNRLLLERQKELVRYERELQIGREIQTSFLPSRLPELPGWEVEARFHPAREVAGDFYDVFPLEDSGRFGLVIADVTDKGVGAALFMALFRTLIRAFANSGGERRTVVRDTVARTNDYILENHVEANMFATLFYGVLEPRSGLLTYVNGGHNPPVIIGPTGVRRSLKPTGPAVGVFPRAKFEVDEVGVAPGDTLFAFTDGLTDARNLSGNLFGQRRLATTLEPPASSAAALLDQIEECVREHVGDARQFDDITMMALRRIPHEQST